MPIFFHRPDGLRQRDLCQRSPRVRGQPEVPADPPAAVTYREQPAASGLLDQGLQAQPAGESWKDLAYNPKSLPILCLGFIRLKKFSDYLLLGATFSSSHLPSKGTRDPESPILAFVTLNL